MKKHNLVLFFLLGLNACNDLEVKDHSSLQSTGGYLSKEEVVKGLLAAGNNSASGSYLQGADSAAKTTADDKLLDKNDADDKSLDKNDQDTDLRQWASPVQNQGGEQTCTAFSTIASMELAAKIKTGKSFNLSERHLWSLDQQGAVATIVAAASKKSIMDEKAWPYQTSSKPASAASAPGVVRIKKYSAISKVQGIIQALKKRQPVVFGGNMPIYNSKGIVSNYHAGQHAMAIFGAQVDSRVKGGGYFIVRNSYGPNDGDKGYIYLPFSYCEKTCWAHAIEEVEVSGEDTTTTDRKEKDTSTGDSDDRTAANEENTSTTEVSSEDDVPASKTSKPGIAVGI